MLLQRRRPGSTDWSDEGPFNPDRTKQVYELVRRMAEEFGSSWRVVSSVDKRVLAIYDGKRWIDDPAQIADRPWWARDVPSAFMGTEPAALDDFQDTVPTGPRKDLL